MTASDGQKGRKNICGDRVKSLRKEMPGMTQENLAAKLQINGGDFVRLTINRIEKGERSVTDYELVQLADILGVDIDYLVCGNLSVHEMAQLLAKEHFDAESAAGSGDLLAAEGNITEDTDTIGE